MTHHAAASSFAAGAKGSAIGYLRGRPLGRLCDTTAPATSSSPPQTPHGSRRRSAQPGTLHEWGSPSTRPWPPPHRQALRRRTGPDSPNDRAARRRPTAPAGERLSGHLLRHTCRPTFLIMRCPVKAPRIWPGNTKAADPGCLGATALEAVGVATPVDYRKVVPCWSKTCYR